MAREIAWTADAIDDLESAAAYIERDSPYHAGRFVQAAFRAVASLAEFAERGAMVPQFERDDLRQMIVGRYRLVYKLTATSVIILRLIHHARDFQQAWVNPQDGSGDDDLSSRA